MSTMDDKFIGPFRRLVRQMTNRVDFYALYSAVVNVDNGDGTVDMTPEDTRLPSMSGIPKAYGLPGVDTTLTAGSKVLFCFENGDPSRPRVVLYAAQSTSTASKVALNSTGTVEIAGNTDAVALASLANARISSIWTLLNAVAASDNNAGLITARTTLVAAQPGFPASVASTKVKAS